MCIRDSVRELYVRSVVGDGGGENNNDLECETVISIAVCTAIKKIL